jgi:plasmid stabilization system protein ParE
MSSLLFEPEAVDDLAAAAAWYEERTPSVGIRLLFAVHETVRLIAEQPTLFALVPRVARDLEVRRALVAVFPYFVIFRVRGDEIRIIAVAHAKRRPGYWRDRVR